MDFEVEDDFKIIVRDPSLIKVMLQAFDSLDDRTFANFFLLELLLEFRQAYAIYFITGNELEKWGLQRAKQRFEQCLKIVQMNMPVAFASLLAKSFGEKITDVEEVSNRTLKFIIDAVESDEFIPSQHRKFMSEKLKNLKLILAYPKELLSVDNIEEVYKNLKLTGSESFLKMFVDSFIFSRDQRFKNLNKANDMEVERNESLRWIDFTSENEYETPIYTLDTINIICE